MKHERAGPPLVEKESAFRESSALCGNPGRRAVPDLGSTLDDDDGCDTYRHHR